MLMESFHLLPQQYAFICLNQQFKMWCNVYDTDTKTEVCVSSPPYCDYIGKKWDSFVKNLQALTVSIDNVFFMGCTKLLNHLPLNLLPFLFFICWHFSCLQLHLVPNKNKFQMIHVSSVNGIHIT